jgi:hypothetical protein
MYESPSPYSHVNGQRKFRNHERLIRAYTCSNLLEPPLASDKHQPGGTGLHRELVPGPVRLVELLLELDQTRLVQCKHGRVVELFDRERE